jgi:hypothetical protein
MTYETVVAELFARFPRLRATYDTGFAYMGDDAPGAYTVIGSVLIPALEEALDNGDLASILPICAFLEDIADAAHKDTALETLLRIEIGEWLGRTANEGLIAPWLGVETKRICRYVPGLATQRLALQTKRREGSYRSRISSLMKRLRIYIRLKLLAVTADLCGMTEEERTTATATADPYGMTTKKTKQLQQ